jgi:recombination associated protein RdgC
MFRNVRYFRIKGDWPRSEEAVSTALSTDAFTPCRALVERSSGWIPVDAGQSELLARRLNGADLFRLRSQSRVLPPAVINEAVEERVDEFRARMQQDPSHREKRRLKAETRDALLPKAMLKSDRIWGYVDLDEKIIGINSAQEATCDRFLQHVRIAIKDLKTTPLQFNNPVESLLTGIFLGTPPARFHVGRECRMQDAKDAGSSVRWTDFDLTDKTIRDHVADGMRLTHLAVEYDNILSCVIDENGGLSKLRLLGADDKDTQDDGDQLARQDAEFVLLSGTLRQLLGDLKKLLGGFA